MHGKKVVGRSVSKENGMNFGLNLPTFRQNRSLKVPQNVKTATLPESLSSLIFERGVSELQPNVSRCFGSEFYMFLGKNLIVACDSSCKIGSKNSIVL